MEHRSNDWQWLDSFETVAVSEEHSGRTGPVESLVVTLSGTFDVQAGGGSWLARGIRATPFDGKPVALFLPPNTPYSFANGSGELLIVRGRQPEQKPVKGEATSKKPLLALAGSGKAFDPASGEWKREEDFPSSPEAILPRRVEVSTSAAGVIHHVFPFGYKALCLSLDEMLIRGGGDMQVPNDPVSDYPVDRAIYYDATEPLRIGDQEYTGRGLVPAVDAGSPVHCGGDAYLAIAYAGPKLT